ncbi:unnamed protein product [Rotaria socialis]|uniref:Uncharacterized protein n=1 Tax=Rotaria socialis TaxID=392032 RepID=A0A817WDM2_9BILA|nr:unnamed protein product [Rotaria socialis]CAF3361657.1 unnamed protein product [Rotaria socialis]CAF3426990.1 unnamed protein product [Rotaria socialis]CAF3447983.1 unnamed protein product [Rotaria socialis]CAF3532080.1 unnamed protein product [Rotaria socialis]
MDSMNIIADLQANLIKTFLGEDAAPDKIQYVYYELSLYVRHNRAKRGNLRVGDPAIGVDLLKMNGKSISLLSHCNPNRALLFLVGSYT